jgi:Leucine-rich repeat (LRR) protein
MIDFIKKIEKKFDTSIFESDVELNGENTFEIDENGQIKSLVIRKIGMGGLDSLIPIAEQIRNLTLEDCQILDLNSLKFFKNIEFLNLNRNPITTLAISQLSYLNKLNDLKLKFTEIDDTSPLQGVTNLQSLDLSFNNKLLEVKGLEKIKTLERLDFQFNQVDRIGKIQLNPNIKILNFKAGKFSEISGLESYECLIDLDLSSNQITTIQGLSDLKKLNRLKLSTARISKIEGLNELESLKILDMSNQHIQRIEGLDQLEELKQLNLSENDILEISGLDKLINLEYILLDYNKIESFDSNLLKNVKSQCLISLVGNPINQVKELVSDFVKIQFEEPNWVPKSL